MKCPIFKYLNTREEARKHLNKDSFRNLGAAHKNLGTLEVMVAPFNCEMHDVKIPESKFEKHLADIFTFSAELCSTAKMLTEGIPQSTLQTLLNKYPDPRKDNK
jgi:hypothetical protein